MTTRGKRSNSRKYVEDKNQNGDQKGTVQVSHKDERKHNSTLSSKSKVNQPPFAWFQPTNEGKDGEDENNGFQVILDLLRSKKRILVLCGAGMSVSCGIPDFRSKNGLYATLNFEELGLHSAEDLFDIEVFRDNPAPFYKFAQEHFLTSVRKEMQPSTSHGFLSMLHKNKQLLRVYTQNIDGLEEVAGLPSKMVVYAHGSLSWAQCMTCKKKIDSNVIVKDMEKGLVPRCQNLVPVKSGSRLKGTSRSDSLIATSSSDVTSSSGSEQPGETRSKRQKRSCTKNIPNNSNSVSNASIPKLGKEDPNVCNGPMKPGITFFGEKLQCNVAKLLESDRKKADALLVIGTSLSVAPMSNVIQYISPSTPRILINRTFITPPKSKPSSNEDDCDNSVKEKDFRENYLFDAYLLGECDTVTRALATGLRLQVSTKSNGGVHTKNKECPNSSVTIPASLKDNDDVIATTNKEVAARTFVFEGACLEMGEDTSDGVEVREVVHCDGCQTIIEESIMKCQDCFDFDLCVSCFPKVSRKHFKGNHKFRKERCS